VGLAAKPTTVTKNKVTEGNTLVSPGVLYCSGVNNRDLWRETAIFAPMTDIAHRKGRKVGPSQYQKRIPLKKAIASPFTGLWPQSGGNGQNNSHEQPLRATGKGHLTLRPAPCATIAHGAKIAQLATHRKQF